MRDISSNGENLDAQEQLRLCSLPNIDNNVTKSLCCKIYIPD
jgi:hypothetical protein